LPEVAQLAGLPGHPHRDGAQQGRPDRQGAKVPLSQVRSHLQQRAPNGQPPVQARHRSVGAHMRDLLQEVSRVEGL